MYYRGSLERACINEGHRGCVEGGVLLKMGAPNQGGPAPLSWVLSSPSARHCRGAHGVQGQTDSSSSTTACRV